MVLVSRCTNEHIGKELASAELHHARSQRRYFAHALHAWNYKKIVTSCHFLFYFCTAWCARNVYLEISTSFAHVLSLYRFDRCQHAPTNPTTQRSSTFINACLSTRGISFKECASFIMLETIASWSFQKQQSAIKFPVCVWASIGMYRNVFRIWVRSQVILQWLIFSFSPTDGIEANQHPGIANCINNWEWRPEKDSR